VSFEEGLQFTFFLRKPNNNSSFCKECHVEMVGGLEKGNHPIDIDIKKVPEPIIKAGGKLGKGTPPKIICETCHTPHGGVTNRRLILSIEDPLSRSVLCEACHGKSPLQVKSATAPRFSHPVDVPPGKAAQIPKKWSNGEEVFRGINGVLVCRTCHKPHQAMEKKVLLADHNVRISMCIECHPGKEAIKDSSHDLHRSAPNDKNIQGDRAAELGACSPCHLIHQGTRVICGRSL
jgi:predicted CXXCH cytochrome family protein